jgi:hypothetical protein
MKACPLLFARDIVATSKDSKREKENGFFCSCLKNKCAWWMDAESDLHDGRCAVLQIAKRIE